LNLKPYHFASHLNIGPNKTFCLYFCNLAGAELTFFLKSQWKERENCLEFFVPRHLMFLVLIGALSGRPEPTQIEHMDAILCVLDAQTTSDENSCQARHE
jgi:hypothetical protein